MELSKTDTLIMTRCDGSSQQVWAWKRSTAAAKSVKKETMKKYLRNLRTMTSTSPVRQSQKVAQEIATGDY